MKKYVTFWVVICVCHPVFAQIRLPQFIRDSVILQRDEPANIWGWASAKEKVTITFKNKKYKTIADALGNWKLQLPATAAGGPYNIQLQASNKIVLKEVLFGDVWFCSGQSNMVHQLNIHDVTYADEILHANDGAIRQFLVPTGFNLQGPQTNLATGWWKAAVGEDVRSFSAVAYFFAKRIYAQHKVPIGIINASVGGTPIQAWMSEEAFADFSGIEKIIATNKDSAVASKAINMASSKGANQVLDKGLTGSKTWFDPEYVPRGWHTINIPGYWEDQGAKDLNGVVWYRREVTIPASMVGKPAKVFLGRIVDADILYINGRQVGSTGYQYPQRRYPVAANILKPGKNLFVIKVTNNAGKGGFVPDKPYCIFAGSDTVDLKGYWQYKVGEVYQPQVEQAGAATINPAHQPTVLYNAMVAPFVPYTIKGFLWYQGEADTFQPAAYAKLQPAQIQNWRSLWHQGDIPFLYVQLPGFMDYTFQPVESNWAAFREAQLKSLSVQNTGMAVAIDLGEWNDIHPENKKTVGERLALWAEKLVYKQPNLVCSGPLFQSASIEGNTIRIAFSNVGDGLVSNDGEPLQQFAIAGADKKFVWAQAKIEGQQVTVWSEKISNPQYVRYAWSDNPDGANLFNKNGLPASPFRTDE